MKNKIYLLLYLLCSHMVILSQTTLKGCWKQFYELKPISISTDIVTKTKLCVDADRYYYGYLSDYRLLGGAKDFYSFSNRLDNNSLQKESNAVLGTDSDFEMCLHNEIITSTYLTRSTELRPNITQHKNIFAERTQSGSSDLLLKTQMSSPSTETFFVKSKSFNPFMLHSYTMSNGKTEVYNFIRSEYDIKTSSWFNKNIISTGFPIKAPSIVQDYDYTLEVRNRDTVVYCIDKSGLFEGILQHDKIVFEPLSISLILDGYKDFKISKIGSELLLVSCINSSNSTLHLFAITTSNLTVKELFTSENRIFIYDVVFKEKAAHLSYVDAGGQTIHSANVDFNGNIEIFPVISSKDQVTKLSIDQYATNYYVSYTDKAGFHYFHVFQPISVEQIFLASINTSVGQTANALTFIPNTNNQINILNCSNLLFDVALSPSVNDMTNVSLSANDALPSPQITRLNFSSVKKLYLTYFNGCATLTSPTYTVNYQTTLPTPLVQSLVSNDITMSSNPFNNTTVNDTFTVVSNTFPQLASFSYTLDGGRNYISSASKRIIFNDGRVALTNTEFSIRYDFPNCPTVNSQVYTYNKLTAISNLSMVRLQSQNQSLALYPNQDKTFMNCSDSLKFTPIIDPALPTNGQAIVYATLLDKSRRTYALGTSIDFTLVDTLWVEFTQGNMVTKSPKYTHQRNSITFDAPNICSDITKSYTLPGILVNNQYASTYSISGVISNQQGKLESFDLSNTNSVNFSSPNSYGSLYFTDLTYTIDGCSNDILHEAISVYQIPDSSLLTIKRLDITTDPHTVYYLDWQDQARGKIELRYPTSSAFTAAYRPILPVNIRTFRTFPDTLNFSFPTNPAVNEESKSIVMMLSNNEAPESCFISFTKNYMVKKRTLADLRPRIIGDTSVKPESVTKYVFYFQNQIVTNLLEYRWTVKDTNGNVMDNRSYEINTLDKTSNNVLLYFKKAGKYRLVAEILKVSPAGNTETVYVDSLNIACKNPDRIITSSGTVIDPNKLALTICKVDTIMCSGLYIDSLHMNELRYSEDGCPLKSVIDNTNIGIYATLIAGEANILNIDIGNEGDSVNTGAFIGVWIDLDNDGEIGEQGEVIEATQQKSTSYQLTNVFIENKDENIGERRMMITLSMDKSMANASPCEIIENPEHTLTEYFMIKVEKVSSIQVTSLVTPNADGKNDYFDIRGIDTRYTTNLKVYSKMGRKIYDKDSYGLSFNNSEDRFESTLRPDTYYYIFVNGSNTVKGFFEVK